MPLTDDEVRFLCDRNEELKGIRRLYEPLWEEIAEYVFPRRVGIGSEPTVGAKQTTKMYDSTAPNSHAELSAIMHDSLTPDDFIWSTFKLRDDRLNKIKEVKDWIEAVASTMSVVRSQSNFSAEMDEVYLDFVAFGTACLFIEEKPIYFPGFNGLRYKAIPNNEYCVSEDADGRVDTLFREFELSARAAVKKFGKEVGEKIIKEAENKPETRFKFLHATIPLDMEFNRVGKKNWNFYYIHLGEKDLLRDGGYYEFPYIVPRWSKSSGEDYGRGPTHIALPDVKTLNKAKEFGLKAWAKDLDPPTFEKDNGVIGSLKLWPGGRNIARDKESIWTMEHHIRYDASQLKQEELQLSIQRAYYIDQIMNQIRKGPEMTATEVQVRYELMQRILGPTLGRFNGEALNPCIEREFGLMMRASSGRFPVLPPPPQILAQMGVTDIDIEYEGPLAKAQRRGEMKSMQNVAQVAIGMIQGGFNPEILDNFDGDKVIQHASDVEGIPSKVMRSTEQVAAIREKRAKLQAIEQQKQDLERLAAGAKDAAPMVGVLGGQGENTA